MQHFGNHASFLGPIEMPTTRRHFKVKQEEVEDSKNIDAVLLLLSKFSITQVSLRLTHSVHPHALLRAYFPLPPSSSQPLRCIPRKARGVDLFLMPSLSKKTDPLSRSMFSLPPHLTHSCFPRPILRSFGETSIMSNTSWNCHLFRRYSALHSASPIEASEQQHLYAAHARSLV